MLKTKNEDEFFDLLMQDFNDDDFNEGFVDKKRVRRVFVAS